MTAELEAGLASTKMTIIGFEMPIEGETGWKREENKGIIPKGMSINLSKSKRTNPLSRLEV